MASVLRESAFAGVLLCVGAAAGHAQMHHVDAPERVTRAVGVYEWTGDLNKPTAARFVPVSLFIDGHFEDAGLYLARPVPFALENGDLYTVERSGEPEGVFDLEMAQHVVSGNALADDNPAGVWYGFGKFTAEAAPKPVRSLRQSGHVAQLQVTPAPGSSGSSGPAGANGKASPAEDTDNSRPQLSRRTPAGAPGNGSGQDSSTGASDASTGEGKAGSPGPSSGSGSGGANGSSDDTDRPTLARRDPSQDAGRRRTAVGGKGNTASVTAVGPAPGDDPDRPTLTHKSADTGTTKELTGMPADLHQAVAVSDPVVRDPHPFARGWDDAAERASVLAAMEALAKPNVAAYLTANKLVPSTGPVAAAGSVQNTEGVAANTEGGEGAAPTLQRGKPWEYGGTTPAPASGTVTSSAKPAGTGRRTAAKVKAAPASPLSLQDEQISGFTLSYGGLPTFVYTAGAPVALAPGSPSTGMMAHPTAFVTVVAQRLPTGELQVAMAAVTDSQHLDRAPRLHLIDAVDPDASHRASLLFELRGSASRQFALYRLITARAENTFTTASIE